MDIYIKMKLIIGLLCFQQGLTLVQGYEYNYVGCFNDRRYPNRAMSSGIFKTFFQNSPNYCVKKCAHNGYRYFGLQETILCFCANSGYDKYGISTTCNYPCIGDISQICGGDISNSVYEIVYPSATTATKTVSTVISTTTTERATTSIYVTTTSSTTEPHDGKTSAHDRSLSKPGASIASGVGAVIGCATIVLVTVLVLRKYARREAINEEAPFLNHPAITENVVREDGIIDDTVQDDNTQASPRYVMLELCGHTTATVYVKDHPMASDTSEDNSTYL